MHTFPAPTPAPVQTLSFSENGTWLASAHQGQTTITILDLRKTNVLKTIDIGTPVEGLSWDYTGQFLAGCGPGGIVISQYMKSSKSWTEPLRKALDAKDSKWGAKAKSMVVLTSDGSLNILRA